MPHTLAAFLFSQVSPFMVPIAGCAMVLGIVLAGVWSGVRNREMQAQERLAAIAKGVPVPPTPEELALMHGKPSTSLKRRKANIRLAGIVLLGTALGLIAFFITLSYVVQERNVLAGACVALIPLGIGVGFLVDARISAKELEEDAAAPPTSTSLLS